MPERAADGGSPAGGRPNELRGRGAQPRGGPGTQVPGLPFPGRAAASALGAAAMVWALERLPAWTRRPREILMNAVPSVQK